MTTKPKPDAFEQTAEVLAKLYPAPAPHSWKQPSSFPTNAVIAATVFAAVTQQRALDRLTAAIKENTATIRDNAAPKKLIRTPEEQDRDLK
jgi:hypothetical protein